MIETNSISEPDICCLLPPSTSTSNPATASTDSTASAKATATALKRPPNNRFGNFKNNSTSNYSFKLTNFLFISLAILCCLSLLSPTLAYGHILPPNAVGRSADTASPRDINASSKGYPFSKETLHQQSSTLESERTEDDEFLYLLSQRKGPNFSQEDNKRFRQLGIRLHFRPDEILQSKEVNEKSEETGRLDELISHLSERRDELNPVERQVKRSFEMVAAPTSHLGPVMKLYRHFKPRMVKRAEESQCPKEDDTLSAGEKIGYGFLIPILVLLSGVFAGLTIGYMSLDDTQLQVLIAQGTPSQKKKAEKIMIVRKDPHRLLTTLLIANMCTNETLPIIAEPAFGGGLQAVIGSIVLVIVFAELIPQSVCARFGLEVGAYMAWPTRITMIIFWPIAYPVSRVLHWTLGAHQGIIYRRGELKELVTMHAATGGRGGDLQKDTVMLVGGALDLQEKVVKEAMTPIEKVFMLPLSAKLDYPTLERIVRSGHSRIPIYHEIEVPVHSPKTGVETHSKRGIMGAFTRRASSKQDKSNSVSSLPDGVEASKPPTSGPNGFTSAEDEKAAAAFANQSSMDASTLSNIPGIEMVKRKKILGTLLVKSCVLLDPEDAVPVSALTLNALPTVPGDEPLLNVLNVFQEGRSHMAIVSPRPRSVGLSRSVADVGSKTNLNPALPPQRTGTLDTAAAAKAVDGLGHIDEEKPADHYDLESASTGSDSDGTKRGSIWRRFRREDKVQSEDIASQPETITPETPSQSHEDAPEYSENFPDEGLPIGIITMEDVLEELLQEEIYDEYDNDGEHENAFTSLSPPPSPGQIGSDSKAINEEVDANTAPTELDADGEKKTVLQRLGIARKISTRNSPQITSDAIIAEPEEMKEVESSSNEGVSTALGTEEAEDYLNARNVSFTASPNPSRPPTPSQTQLAFGNGNASTNPLASPTPSLATNRPLVVRTQAPTGQLSTSVVSENYLRGRRPGGILGMDTSSSGTETPPTRSTTPAGHPSTSQSRGNRFKSTPLNSGNVTPGIIAPIRARSQDQRALDAQAASAGSNLVVEDSQTSPEAKE